MDSETKYDRPGGGRAYRSRLEPFVDFIRQQRQQRKTWQQIAALLRTDKGCDVTFQGLHQFYRRYLKRKSRPHWEDQAMPQPSAEPATARRVTIVAATPALKPFKQPDIKEMQLNDPTKIQT
jgi:hypothetical protein